MIADSWPGAPDLLQPHVRRLRARARVLGNNVLTQGLASKVFVPPPAPTKDTVFVQGDGWFDVQRTKSLWTTVFKAPNALIRRGDWIDQPSVGIPYLYVATGLELAEMLRDQDPASARDILNQTRAVASAVRLESAVANIDQIAIPIGDSARGRLLPAPPPAAKQP